MCALLSLHSHSHSSILVTLEYSHFQFNNSTLTTTGCLTAHLTSHIHQILQYIWTPPSSLYNFNRIKKFKFSYIMRERLRWSRGSVLAFSTQVRGFKPSRSHRIFKGEKILSTPSFRGEVKPSVPGRRFVAYKRSLMAWIETPCRQNYQTTFLAHSCIFRC